MTDENTINEEWKQSSYTRPVFNRPQVAKLLNCTTLTVANRETKGVYPVADRNLKSKHRIYSLQQVFQLQYITFKGQINLSSIASLLWDMGYTMTNKVLPCLQLEINLFKSTIPADVKVNDVDPPHLDTNAEVIAIVDNDF